MQQPELQGLTAAEVAQRVRCGQVNRSRDSNWVGYARIVSSNLFTLFNALVVPAAASLFLLGDYRAAWSVSGMAVINTVIGLVQETRAKRHLDRLAVLTQARARVLREGDLRDIPADDVVQGDCVALAAGEPVVADGPVLACRFLEVDEALLTGESEPVPRHQGELLLSGSYCVAGEGHYRAERVGGQAFAQHLSSQARFYRYSAGPIQRSVNAVLWLMTCVAVTLSALYAGFFYMHILSQEELWRMIAATVTSLVPQGLVLLVTVALSLGAVRLSRTGALVQRLDAVETMAAIEWLCLDKTGTLTTNRLHVEELCLLADDLSREAVKERLRLFTSASVDQRNKNIAALRAALGDSTVLLLDQVTFTSQRRYSAVHVRAAQAEHFLVLGAPEALRDHVDPTLVKRTEAACGTLLTSGLRLLLFAEARGPAAFHGSLDGFLLQPLALVGLSDELRPGVREVLHALQLQGIRFKVVSGDNPQTVLAVVRQLALGPAFETAVSGDELARAPDRARLIRGHGVFGRIAPQQKVDIVQALQDHGRYVAMIGDGINDVLPLKRAHLGIAMGEGSRAAQLVSGMVLETNDFGLLPSALEEGRIIVRNLRRCGKILLVKNVYAILLIIGAPGVLGLPFPYLPQQVTLLNFLTIGVPALFITLNRKRTMVPAGPGWLREVGSFAVRTGIVIGLAGLCLLFVADRTWGHNPLLQRSLLLSLLVLCGSATVLRALREDGWGTARDDALLYTLALGAVPVYLVILYCPVSADFFQLSLLTFVHWAIVLAVAVPALAVLVWSDQRWRARS